LKINLEFDLETLRVNKERRKGKQEIYGCASIVEVSPVDLAGGSWIRFVEDLINGQSSRRGDHA
jgi:hypothetical protein